MATEATTWRSEKGSSCSSSRRVGSRGRGRVVAARGRGCTRLPRGETTINTKRMLSNTPDAQDNERDHHPNLPKKNKEGMSSR